MRNLIRGSGALVRACALLGLCAGLIAACSDDDDSSSATSGGTGGSAGSSSPAGESSGGSDAKGGKGGAAQGGKAGSDALGGADSAGTGGAEPGPDAGGAGGQGGGTAGGDTGGASEAGAGGNGGNTCPVYDPKLVPVDQSQLGGTPDSWNLFESSGIGQFITSGKTGLLAAVELSLAVACNEKKGTIELYVYDALSNTKLGQAGVPMSVLACKNGGNLAANTIGVAFFDFASQCIHVTAAQKLRVDLHLVDTGMCDDLKCVGGSAAGNNCTTDAQCSGIIISASQPSTYAGGSIAFKGVAGSADDNLNFKTFVAN
jgi:hypothetical protein